MSYAMQYLEDRRWAPGTVLLIPSDLPSVFHFVMVEFLDCHTGQELCIHNMPGVGVARAPLDEVIGKKSVSRSWPPQTPEQGTATIERMQGLIGMPYDLFQANCEHAIRWAVTGQWRSEQVSALGVGLLFAAAFVAVESLQRRR